MRVLQNNLAKIAKWTMCALLAGADMVKLGYVSRAGPKDNSHHVILGTQTSKPKDLAGQMSLNVDHCWGIVRALVDMIMKQPEGEGRPHLGQGCVCLLTHRGGGEGLCLCI